MHEPANDIYHTYNACTLNKYTWRTLPLLLLLLLQCLDIHDRGPTFSNILRCAAAIIAQASRTAHSAAQGFAQNCV